MVTRLSPKNKGTKIVIAKASAAKAGGVQVLKRAQLVERHKKLLNKLKAEDAKMAATFAKRRRA